MNTLVVEIKGELPWELIFSDNMAHVAETEEELQEKVLSWQRVLGEGGLKMNATKSDGCYRKEVEKQECRSETSMRPC